MLLLVSSGLVFFPSDEPEGEGLPLMVGPAPAGAPRARRHPQAASQGAGRLRPKAGTAPQGLPAAPGPF